MTNQYDTPEWGEWTRNAIIQSNYERLKDKMVVTETGVEIQENKPRPTNDERIYRIRAAIVIGGLLFVLMIVAVGTCNGQTLNGFVVDTTTIKVDWGKTLLPLFRAYEQYCYNDSTFFAMSYFIATDTNFERVDSLFLHRELTLTGFIRWLELE